MAARRTRKRIFVAVLIMMAIGTAAAYTIAGSPQEAPGFSSGGRDYPGVPQGSTGPAKTVDDLSDLEREALGGISGAGLSGAPFNGPTRKPPLPAPQPQSP